MHASLGPATAAVQAAQRGWHVFPVCPGDKRPAVERWEQQASADPETVCQEFTGRWSGCNYGIACGPSGLVVIDLDLSEQGNGEVQFVELCRAAGLGEVPATLIIRTPRGGLHLFFSAVGTNVRNSVGRLASAIDVRAAGGFAVGPGSVLDERAYDKPVTLIDGGRYTVVREAPVAPLPAWLAERAAPAPAPDETSTTATSRSPAPTRARLVGLVAEVLSAPLGRRNNTLFWASCRASEMVAAGEVDVGAVRNLLLRAAAETGLGSAEAERTIRSALAREVAA